MALTLWINEISQFMQKRLERKIDKMNNILEDLASWSWVVKVTTSSWGMDLEIK